MEGVLHHGGAGKVVDDLGLVEGLLPLSRATVGHVGAVNVGCPVWILDHSCVLIGGVAHSSFEG